MHVFGRWEEARVPGENPRIHGENMQTLIRIQIQIFVFPSDLVDGCILWLLLFLFCWSTYAGQVIYQTG